MYDPLKDAEFDSKIRGLMMGIPIEVEPDRKGKKETLLVDMWPRADSAFALVWDGMDILVMKTREDAAPFVLGKPVPTTLGRIKLTYEGKKRMDDITCLMRVAEQRMVESAVEERPARRLVAPRGVRRAPRRTAH